MTLKMLAFVVACGCGGASAESPLTVPLGLSRAATVQALHAHQYCRTPDPHRAEADVPKEETYPRCGRTAAEWGESWVTARFDRDKLVELRRWERYTDDARAVERWNELVAARIKASAPSDDALKALKLLPGTRSVKAFRADNGSVVGVYLLTPTPPENANILEKVIAEN